VSRPPPAKHFDSGIVGTAFLTRDGELLTLPRPARHPHYHWLYNFVCRGAGWDFPWVGWTSEKLERAYQGFVTIDGRFVGRTEAGRIALREGQIERLHWGSRLYSEDLW
jgi:hypothetical protein